MNDINDPADMFFNFIEKEVIDLGGKSHRGAICFFLQAPPRKIKAGNIVKVPRTIELGSGAPHFFLMFLYS
jgi:hypothetical protein